MKLKGTLSSKIIMAFLLFIYILITNFTLKTGYAQTSYLIHLDSEGVGTGDGRGTIFIDGKMYTDLPGSTNIQDGPHIIYYLPHEEDRFLEWVVSGSIRLESPLDSDINAYGIYVTGSCSLFAYYEAGPVLNIENIHPRSRDVFIDTPIELKVKVTAEGKLIDGAMVSFFADGERNRIGFEYTENGYASITHEFIDAREHIWGAQAEKVGYTTNKSPTWKFDYVEINLDPKDKDVVKSFPIILGVEVGYPSILKGTASFYIDDDYLGDDILQDNGLASYITEKLSPGQHKWLAIIDTEKFGKLNPPPQEFYLRKSLTSYLDYPVIDENLTTPTSKINLTARVLWDNLPVMGANVSFHVDGRYKGSNYTDEHGIALYNFYPEKEGTYYKWYVEATQRYCDNDTSRELRFFYPIQPPYIEVDETLTTRSRADINSHQTVGFHLRLENGSDAMGAHVRITEELMTVTNEDGWAIFSVSNPNVGKQTWKILEVSCPGIGELKNEVAPPSIIWDEVQIELSVQRSRIDVGTRLNPTYEAYYEYDKDEFDGSIFYNTDLYINIVQDKDIKVQKITDNKYGLSIFRGNVINVIWDQVYLDLEIKNDKLQIGSEAEITCRKWYEYDKMPFNGHYELNNPLKKNTIGTMTYKVSQINDPQYSLTAFNSNEVSCMFDEITIDQRVETGTPSQVQVITKVMFSSDNSAVENAVVDVNGEGIHVGNGVYISTIHTFSPQLVIDTKVTASGYETIFTHRTVTLTGNLFMESGIAIFITSVISLQAYRSYKSAQIWKQNLNELEGILKKRKGVGVSQVAKEMNVETGTIQKLFAELVAKTRIQGEAVKNGFFMLLDEVPIKRIESRRDLKMDVLSKDLDITEKEAERITRRLFKQGKLTGKLISTVSGLHAFTFPSWNKRLKELETLLNRSKGREIASISKSMKLDSKIIRLLFTDLRSKDMVRGELVKNGSVILPDEIFIKRIDVLDKATFRKLAQDLDITTKEAEKITRRLNAKSEIEVLLGYICPNCSYLREESLAHVTECLQCNRPFGNWEKGFELSGTRMFKMPH